MSPSGTFLPLAGTLALLAAAAAFTTGLLGPWLGPVGVPVATLLLTVGNSTSGATIGVVPLPGTARIVSWLLPPGTAIRARARASPVADAAHWHPHRRSPVTPCPG